MNALLKKKKLEALTTIASIFLSIQHTDTFAYIQFTNMYYTTIQQQMLETDPIIISSRQTDRKTK